MSKNDENPEDATTGFDLGLEAEKIIGLIETNGCLTFLIKFKGIDRVKMVPSSIANEKIPQMVIAFYQERICWISDNEE